MSFPGRDGPLQSCDDPENEEPWLHQLIRRAREEGEVDDKATNVDLLLQDEYPSQGKRRRAAKWFDKTGIGSALETEDPYNHPWSTDDSCWYWRNSTSDKELLQTSNGVQSTLKLSKTLQNQATASMKEPGSESTRIYATNPHADLLALLLWDATRREAKPRFKIIQSYVRGQDSGPSIEIAINSENGGITDSWSFNLPSLRLTSTRNGHSLDDRKIGDGDERWRKSEDISFFAQDTDGDLKDTEFHAIHEVNQSLLVLRHSKNESNWTALCLRDTFPYGSYDEEKNENAELLEHYTEKPEKQSDTAWDPIMFGENAAVDAQNADVFFFVALQYHLTSLQDAAEDQYEILKPYIQDRYKKVTNSDLRKDRKMISISELFDRHERDDKWVSRTTELLRKLRENWSSTIRSWEKAKLAIQNLDNSRVTRSIGSIEKAMRELEDNVESLDGLLEILRRVSEVLERDGNILNNLAVVEQVKNGRIIIQANIITVGSSWMQFCVLVAILCLFNRGFNFEDPGAILHQLYRLIHIVLESIQQLVPDRWSRIADTTLRRLPWMRPRPAIPYSPRRNVEHRQIAVGHIDTESEEVAFGTFMSMDIEMRRQISRPKPVRLPSGTTLLRHETETTLVDRQFTTGPLPTSRQHTNTNTAEANMKRRSLSVT